MNETKKASKKKPSDLPDVEELRSLFSCDAATGVLRWNFRDGNASADNAFNAQWGGKVAGTKGHAGHTVVLLKGKRRLAHRIAWKMIHGVEPPDEIDHINGDPSDNRISNLRAADHSQNMANRKTHRNSTTGAKGVYKYKGKFCARVRFRGKIIRIKGFSTVEEAKARRDDLARKLHGEFFRQ